MEGKGPRLSALRKPNAEGCQASCGQHQAVAPKQRLLPSTFLFLQVSPKREMIRTLRVLACSLASQQPVFPCCSLSRWQGLSPGRRAGPWLPCCAGPVHKWVTRGLSRSELILWPKNCQSGLWGTACSCSQGVALPWTP